MENKWKQYGENLKSTLSATTVGLELALSVGLGYWIGDWADGHLGTAPWLMIVGVGLGSVAGFLNLFRSLKRLQSRRDE